MDGTAMGTDDMMADDITADDATVGIGDITRLDISEAGTVELLEAATDDNRDEATI